MTNTLTEDQQWALSEVARQFHTTRLTKDIWFDPELIAVLLGYGKRYKENADTRD